MVADRHYDTELHALDWPGIGEKYSALVEVSESRAESLEIIDRMLQELGDSHCIVGELKDAASVSSPYIFGAADPGIDLRLVAGEALVTRVKPGSSAARAGLRTGFVLTAIDGTPVSEITDSASQRPPFTPSNELFFRVQALLCADDRVIGVETSAGRRTAGAVVLALGYKLFMAWLAFGEEDTAPAEAVGNDG